jgi:hypothetical protein
MHEEAVNVGFWSTSDSGAAVEGLPFYDLSLIRDTWGMYRDRFPP